MPADVFVQPAGGKADYDVVPPGHLLPLEIYNEELESDMVMTVICDTTDQATGVFMFRRPEGLKDVERISQDNLVTLSANGILIASLEHEQERLIIARSPADRASNIGIYVGHVLAMSPDIGYDPMVHKRKR